MRRLWWMAPAALLLALSAPAGNAFQEDEVKPVPAAQEDTPEDEVQALKDEYDDAMQEYSTLRRGARSPEDLEAASEKYPSADDFAARFLAIAEKHPKGDAAADALVWVVERARSGEHGGKALDLLLRDHIERESLASICGGMQRDSTVRAEGALRKLMQKSPHAAVQGMACFSLAKQLNQQVEYAARVTESEESFERYVGYLGEEEAERLSKLDAKATQKEVESLYARVSEDFRDLPYRGELTLGDMAERNLFELRNLAIGMVAPDIEGEDIDGVAFKLSDYRGKVVVIDFWGNW